MAGRLLNRRIVTVLLLLLCGSTIVVAQQMVYEDPTEFAAVNARFPKSESNGELAVTAYQRVLGQTEAGGSIDVVLSTSRDGITWTDRGAVVSGVVYQGSSVPPVYSLAVSREGTIVVAVVSYERVSATQGAGTIVVYQSQDGGETFVKTGEAVRSSLPLVAPRLAERADGGWFLFLEWVYAGSDSRLVFSRSDDAVTWDELLLLPIDNRIENQVDTAHATLDGRDVVLFSGENFTALNAGFDERANEINPIEAAYHLMGLFSDDGGLTWSGVDPEDGSVFGPLPCTSLADELAAVGATGREALEELLDSVIPYWYLRVSHSGLPDYGATEYGDIYSRRPHLTQHNTMLQVAWEAGLSRETETTRQVLVAAMNRDGNIVGSQELLTGSGLTRARAEIAYNQPSVYSVNGTVVVIAYNDPSRRGQALAYEAGPFGWTERSLNTGGVATYPVGAVLGDRLHIFWQQRESGAEQTSIAYLEPDQSALPPDVVGVSYALGSRSRSSTATLAWTPAPDAAGIAGYGYVWSRDPEEPVPTETVAGSDVREVSLEADEDGEWYFRIRAVDRIGNWSEPSTTAYFRDTTAPARVRFLPPSLDEDGYLASNTFSLGWEAPPDDIMGGYSYDLVYVASADADVAIEDLSVPAPPDRITITDREISRENYDNGLWALSVAGIDSVGNIGEPAVMYVRMNKYVPVTEIWSVTAIPDPLGRYNVNIMGRGFTANGLITQVILDRDQREPWDHVFDETDEGFLIYSDRSMSGPLLDDIATGEYFIGLYHEERKLQWDYRTLVLERNGTVKFGDFTVVSGPEFTVRQPEYGFLGSVGALAWVIMVLLGAVVAFSGMRMVSIIRDGRFLRMEARALIAGQPLPALGRDKRILEMKRRGIGLRAKFTGLMVMLIVAIVAMVGILLGSQTLNRQREILLKGLEDNINVLMESVVSGAAVLLPEPEIEIVGLTDLPRRTQAMDGALYATITGRAGETSSVVAPEGYNYVWATNDLVILNAGMDEDATRDANSEHARLFSSIERAAVPAQEFTAGLTVVDDPVAAAINGYAADIDAAARERMGDLPRSIDVKVDEVLALITQIAIANLETPEAEAAATVQRRRAVAEARALTDQADALLGDIVGEVKSYPEFDPETFTDDQRDFIFYQIITYMPDVTPEDLTTAQYANGAVRIAVSTDQIVQEIADARLDILRITGLIALAAVAAGVAGALLLAAIVVNPIRRLVAGVEHISTTVDKTKLAGYEIPVRTRDELFQLADTVNAMTRGLVDAAEADKGLKVSSDMQKKFMPLEEVGGLTDKRQLTAAHDDLGIMEFHGYYEGADALSGDYFTYEKLDDKRYALVKCDVSGHGVEAAIIMVEVATIFLNQLRDWRAKHKPARLPELLTTINELVAERGFESKFAAMTVGILDIETGRFRVSHAGDRILQVYRAQAQGVESIELNDAPATGMFPVFMFKPDQEYVEQIVALDPGDILLLATDGIDEAKRLIRDEDFGVMTFTMEEATTLSQEQGWGGDLDEAQDHGFLWDKNLNDITEDFTLHRMHEVLESILTRGSYRLTRALDPLPDHELQFDFTRVTPSAENAVLGLMAVEKVFRLMPDPAAGENDLVRVDRRIADFLEKHFSLFHRYFRYEVPMEQRPDDREEYVYYSHLREEEQRDDLTILAVRRK